MESFVWKDRLVKLVEGCFMLSRAGDHADFDFSPDKPDDDMAFAGNVGPVVPSENFQHVLDIKPLDETRLLLVCRSGNYVLVGDRVLSRMRIDEYDGPVPAGD